MRYLFIGDVDHLLWQSLGYQPIWMVAHPDVWKGAKVTAFRKVMSRYLRAERARFVA